MDGTGGPAGRHAVGCAKRRSGRCISPISTVGLSNSAYLAGARASAPARFRLAHRPDRRRKCSHHRWRLSHGYRRDPLSPGMSRATLVSSVVSPARPWAANTRRSIDDPGIGWPRALPRRNDLVINGSFWGGAAMGEVSAIVARSGGDRYELEGGSPTLPAPVSSFGCLLMRMWIPESPDADDPWSSEAPTPSSTTASDR